MGLLQRALETYETYKDRAGITYAGEKSPLLPVFHILQKAQIEVILSGEGAFVDAFIVPKEADKTIIPVTEESAGRSGAKIAPHPLEDQLQYVSPNVPKRYEPYLAGLTNWAESPYSHPKVCAVLRYVKGETILSDLRHTGILELDEETGQLKDGKINGVEYEKCLIRWRVLLDDDENPPECWMDPSLFQSYVEYYGDQMKNGVLELCLLSGEMEKASFNHPKGTLANCYGAKLISANDDRGFTYRGRFIKAADAGTVGYTATQKAHAALRWVAANQGVAYGGRTFFCWSPTSQKQPNRDFLGMQTSAPDPVQYQDELKKTLDGFRMALKDDDDVVVAALDAATTGRLSITYYNELKASDLMDRLNNWFNSCCFIKGYTGSWIASPSAYQLVSCAFGTERSGRIEADDKILREQAQRVFHCIVDQQPLPSDLVRALACRASLPSAYDNSPGKKTENHERVLFAACAAIRKYHNDRKGTEEWTMNLDKQNRDRSYLFGRLLAVAEKAERATYDRNETRETNAIRMQTVFSERPLYAWRILEGALNPYYQKMKPSYRAFYKNLISEIMELMPSNDPTVLGKRLDDVYLLGYYAQRAELNHSSSKDEKTETVEMEETENERI